MANCATTDAFIELGVVNSIVPCDFPRSGVVANNAFVVFGGFGGVDGVPPFGV